jgi:hypothetical protein
VAQKGLRKLPDESPRADVSKGVKGCGNHVLVKSRSAVPAGDNVRAGWELVDQLVFDEHMCMVVLTAGNDKKAAPGEGAALWRAGWRRILV